MVVEVGEEMPGVLTIQVVVTDGAVVRQASPGGGGRSGVAVQQPSSRQMLSGVFKRSARTAVECVLHGCPGPARPEGPTDQFILERVSARGQDMDDPFYLLVVRRPGAWGPVRTRLPNGICSTVDDAGQQALAALVQTPLRQQALGVQEELAVSGE